MRFRFTSGRDFTDDVTGGDQTRCSESCSTPSTSGHYKPDAPVFILSNRFMTRWCRGTAPCNSGSTGAPRGRRRPVLDQRQPPLFNKMVINHGLPMFVDGERSVQWIADRFNGLPTTPQLRGVLDSLAVLIVIEGLDGAGKRTLTGLTAGLRAAQGRSVATLSTRATAVDHRRPRPRGAARRTRGPRRIGVRDGGALRARPREAAGPRRGAAARSRRRHPSTATSPQRRLLRGPAAPDAGGDMVSWWRKLEYGRLGLPEPTIRCCSTSAWNWPPNGRSASRRGERPGPATPTSAMPGCSSAPAPFTAARGAVVARAVVGGGADADPGPAADFSA